MPRNSPSASRPCRQCSARWTSLSTVARATTGPTARSWTTLPGCTTARMPEAPALYAALASVSPPLDALGALGQPVEVAAGRTVFSEHDACRGFPLVLEGEIRVSK